jgi:hypothetical protein
VPVFGVGEDNCVYFATQLIRGQGLGAILEELVRPRQLETDRRMTEIRADRWTGRAAEQLLSL